jgi:hypothetical protein
MRDLKIVELIGFTLSGGRPSLKKLREKLPISETACTACNGTGFAPVKQSSNPMKRVFPARCGKCDGRGKPSRTTKKRLGRPPTTGRGLQVGDRWHQPEFAAIDAWIEATGESITRREAIRRLVEVGLKGGTQMSEIEPTPELPDNIAILEVRFPTRIRNVLFAAGIKTVGEVREMSDQALLSLPGFATTSITQLHEMLGMPSSNRVKKLGEKPIQKARVATGRSVELGLKPKK